MYWDKCILNLDYDTYPVSYGPYIVDSVVGYGIYHFATLDKRVTPLCIGRHHLNPYSPH